ncbi:hypothetical protein niasHT_002502 [Heterodera trifolii]|uniref:DNA-binding protein SATB n=1 Tax=Heterodera trifolii TaxID=157864 RepID=A0ABD2M850_9BILA
MPANPPTMEEILQQIVQLLANQTNAAAAPQAVQNTVPSLPDVSIFEPSDDKGRINEWLSRFKFALDCAAPNAQDDIKVKCLMNKLSEAAFSEYSRSVLPAAVTDFNFASTLSKLEKLFSKPQSVFIDRYECLKAARAEGEEFRPFINRHKRLLADFRFDELKKEQFNCLMLLTALKAHNDATLRQRILARLATDGDNVTYDAVVEDLINFQSTIAEARAIEVPTSSKYLNVVRQKEKQTNYVDKRSQAKPKTNMPNSIKCWRCGGEKHRPDQCWHKTTKCQKCKFDGHIEKQCAAFHEWRKQNAKKWNNKRVGHLKIGMVAKTTNPLPLLKTEIRFNKKPVHFNLDTGSDIIVIDEVTHANVGRPPINKTEEIGKTFDGTKIHFIGKGIGTFEFNGVTFEDEFYVAKRGALNLLSRDAMDKFGLLDELKQKIGISAVNLCKSGSAEEKKIIPIGTRQVTGTEAKIQALKNAFPEVIKDGIGHCTKEKAHLSLNDDARPIYRKARPVPYNSMDVVERELARLENLGVISKVDHLDWAAPILIVKKADGSARLCIDYSTGLNEALKDCQHPLPIPEDIFATLNGGKMFSQIDLRDAYRAIWSVPSVSSPPPHQLVPHPHGRRPPPQRRRPLDRSAEKSLPPVKFDLFPMLDTEEVVRQIKERLIDGQISQHQFGKTVVSDLLARPKSWNSLTNKGREPFIRMQMFLEDKKAIKMEVNSESDGEAATDGTEPSGETEMKMDGGETRTDENLELVAKTEGIGKTEVVEKEEDEESRGREEADRSGEPIGDQCVPKETSEESSGPMAREGRGGNRAERLKNIMPNVQQSKAKSTHQLQQQKSCETADEVDTADVARRIKAVLANNGISQRAFGEHILKMTSGCVSDLLTKPKPWVMLSYKGLFFCPCHAFPLTRRAFRRTRVVQQNDRFSRRSRLCGRLKADEQQRCAVNNALNALKAIGDSADPSPLGGHQTQQNNGHLNALEALAVGLPISTSPCSSVPSPPPAFPSQPNATTSALQLIAGLASGELGSHTPIGALLKKTNSSNSPAMPNSAGPMNVFPTGALKRKAGHCPAGGAVAPSLSMVSLDKSDGSPAAQIGPLVPPPKKIPRFQRTIITDKQKEALLFIFAHEQRPNSRCIEQLALKLGLTPRTVTNWFHNYRTRQKAKEAKPTDGSDESAVPSAVAVPANSRGSVGTASVASSSPSPSNGATTVVAIQLMGDEGQIDTTTEEGEEEETNGGETETAYDGDGSEVTTETRETNDDHFLSICRKSIGQSHRADAQPTFDGLCEESVTVKSSAAWISAVIFCCFAYLCPF